MKGIFIGDLVMDHVIGGKFKLGRKIGSGSFGELYLGNFGFLVSSTHLRSFMLKN